MPELAHTPQQGAAAYLVLQSSFPFRIEVPANTPVCTASPHQLASKIAPPGRDIHLETPLQHKASGLFLPSNACFSETGMPHNPCRWNGNDKAVHIAMIHTKPLAQEYHSTYQKIPAKEYCFLSRSTDHVTSGSLGAGIKEHEPAMLQK